MVYSDLTIKTKKNLWSGCQVLPKNSKWNTKKSKSAFLSISILQDGFHNPSNSMSSQHCWQGNPWNRISRLTLQHVWSDTACWKKNAQFLICLGRLNSYDDPWNSMSGLTAIKHNYSCRGRYTQKKHLLGCHLGLGTWPGITFRSRAGKIWNIYEGFLATRISSYVYQCFLWGYIYSLVNKCKMYGLQICTKPAFHLKANKLWNWSISIQPNICSKRKPF